MKKYALFSGMLIPVWLFCGVLIAEKLDVSQPTISEHMKILVQSGLVISKRIKQWTFYKRDEDAIMAFYDELHRNL